MHGYDPSDPADLLTTSDVQALLQCAAAAADVNNAIIAVVDRNGTILGVRVESGVSPQITGNTTNKVFAIDGAVSLARTGAYFANDQAPLTSRTIQQISQTTITQREVDSNPDVPDPNGDSTLYGPGFVAPVGIKGHFPPGIMFTPQVDLFDIESTNRDSISTITGTRFNVPAQYVPAGANLVAPESYGQVTGILPTAQARGIATLPGGVPLYKNGQEVGGIGVFFPGTTGYATEENSPLNTPLLFDKKKPDYCADRRVHGVRGGRRQQGTPVCRSPGRSTVRPRCRISPSPSAASTWPASRSTSSARRPGGARTTCSHSARRSAWAIPTTAPTFRSIRRGTRYSPVREYPTAGW